MTSRVLPNLGLRAFYALGEDGWKDATDLAFLKLSCLTQGGVINAISTKPGSPNAGDIYILNDDETTNPNKIAVFDDGDWVHFTPLEGWMLYNRTSNAFMLFNGTSWITLGFADPRITNLIGMDNSLGVIEQTGDSTFAKRPIGATNSTDLLSRGFADARYSLATHTHATNGVLSFNTRVGAVTLGGEDVTTALGFTPQGVDSTLTALASLDATAGLLEQTGADTFTKRTMGVDASTSILTRDDGDGRYPLNNSVLAALRLLNTSTGLLEQTGDDTFAKRSIGAANATDILSRGDADGRYATTSSVTTKQDADPTLTALAGLSSSTGLLEQTGADTFTKRAIGVAVSTDILSRGDGDSRYASLSHTHSIADIVSLASSLNAKQDADTTLDALSGLNSTAGLLEQTGADTFTKRAIGVASSTDIPTRGDGDTRYAAASHAHSIANITGLQAALDSKLPISAIIPEIGSERVLVLGDAFGYVRMTNGAANTVTVPENAVVAFPIGTKIYVVQAGAGQTSIAGAGATVINTPETLDLRKQFSSVTLIKVDTNLWDLDGDLATV